MIKLALKEIRSEGLGNNSSDWRQAQMAAYCEHNNESSGWTAAGHFSAIEQDP
jgi:hypothetical protein